MRAAVCGNACWHQVASRFLAIWAADRLRGETLILLCFGLAATSIALGFAILPELFAGAPPAWTLWAATGLYGFGCGPIFGACNSLPAQHGVQVTGLQMTLLQLGVSCGNTVGPFVASRAFEIETLGVSARRHSLVAIRRILSSELVVHHPSSLTVNAVCDGPHSRASVVYLMSCSQPYASG